MGSYENCSDKVKEMIKNHLECKKYFMEKDHAMSFSYDLEQNMSPEERIAD